MSGEPRMNVIWSYPSGGQGLGSLDERAKRKHLALCNTDRRTCGSPEYHEEADDKAHRLACLKMDCTHKAHGGSNEQTAESWLVREDASGQNRAIDSGHEDSPGGTTQGEQEPDPRWTLQNRPNVDGAKPAIGAGAQASVL